jgi:hypothetical protein
MMRCVRGVGQDLEGVRTRGLERKGHYLDCPDEQIRHCIGLHLIGSARTRKDRCVCRKPDLGSQVFLLCECDREDPKECRTARSRTLADFSKETSDG